ncbi:MAG: hypothetical protein L3J34_03905 [Flavobacteriaceae bacterium]|nr:hypothetical protein [Flavobacteriaceae bacterium]
MKNLENYGVQEMDAREIRGTEGGGIWRTLERISTALGLADFASDVIDGWNSHECAHPR